MDSKRKISCVIPVCKPSEAFYRLVKMLLLQDAPPSEIIITNTVAGDGCTSEMLRDKLARAVKGIRPRRVQKQSLPKEPCEEQDDVAEAGGVSGDAVTVDIKIISVKPEAFDHGGTRRYAASLCSGDYLLFMTQDAVPCDIYLTQRLQEALEANMGPAGSGGYKAGAGAAAAYARQVAAADASEKEKFSRGFNYPETGRVQSSGTLSRYGIKTYFCSNVCAMYRRDIYEELGGFVEKTIFNEDMIYAKKAVDSGYSIIYEPEACVVHSHSYSPAEQLRRNFDLAVSQQQYKESFEAVSSENEGIRYVREALRYFGSRGMLHTAADVIFDSAFRYAGFWLGSRYRHIPAFIIDKLTMNKMYWRD